MYHMTDFLEQFETEYPAIVPIVMRRQEPYPCVRMLNELCIFDIFPKYAQIDKSLFR